jgi:glycine cleavage system H protein
MKVIDNLKYTAEHEWLRVDGEDAYIGVTDFAQHELGDIVFVEVETVGEVLEKGETFGTIEAVKTVSDMYMPISGEVLEFNDALVENPELINKDPFGEGWVIKMRILKADQLDNLLTAEAYKKLTVA